MGVVSARRGPLAVFWGGVGRPRCCISQLYNSQSGRGGGNGLEAHEWISRRTCCRAGRVTVIVLDLH